MKIYKLRNKETGLYFSQVNPNWYVFNTEKIIWTETGKVFNSPKPIFQIRDSWSRYKQPDKGLQELLKCEIVEFDITEVKTIQL